MYEMLDRVARAICCPDGCKGDTGSGNPCYISGEDAMAMRQARAAIQAMREPTYEMVDAGLLANLEIQDGIPAENAWRAMIREALK